MTEHRVVHTHEAKSIGSIEPIPTACSPVLHFLMPEGTESRYPSMVQAVFELALRIGSRFAIHKSIDSVPSDAYVVSYGPVERRDPSWMLLPFASLQSGDGVRACGPIASDDGTLWAPIVNNGVIDVIKGTHDLISFEHEKGSANRLDAFG